MTSNFNSTTPYDHFRARPPGMTKFDWDIIWAPIRDVDVVAERPLYGVLSLTPSQLSKIKQVGFCTDAAVAYNNGMHKRVLIFYFYSAI